MISMRAQIHGDTHNMQVILTARVSCDVTDSVTQISVHLRNPTLVTCMTEERHIFHRYGISNIPFMINLLPANEVFIRKLRFRFIQTLLDHRLRITKRFS